MMSFSRVLVKRRLGRFGGHELAHGLALQLEAAGNEPFLIYVHVFEPHAPYEVASEIARPLVAPYDGEVRGDVVAPSAIRSERELGV